MSVHDKNIAELARDTAAGISSLAANEVRLAAAEVKESLETSAKGLRSAMIGAALLLPAATVGLIGLGFALASIDGVSDWLAFLIVAALAAAGGYAIMKSGKGALSPSALVPKKTVQNLRQDAQTIKEAAS